MEEDKKQRVAELLKVIMPPEETVKGARKRTLICTNGLLEDTLRCVKKLQSTSTDFQLEKRISCREGMLMSKDLGTLLVKREDLHVVESSLGMALFASFEKIKGYRGHSLRVMVHPSDAEDVASLVHKAKVGEMVSVRLMRMCFEESSSCVLSQYVRKEVRVAHVSSDRCSVLLMVNLSERDTAPISTSKFHWDDYFKAADVVAKGHFGVVGSYRTVFQISRHFQQRMKVVDPKGTDSIVQKMWSMSAGYSHVMSNVLLEAMQMYHWVGRDSAGRPCFQMATRLQHGGTTTPWDIFTRQSPNGERILTPSMGGSSEMLSALLLPEDGSPLEIATTVMMLDGKRQTAESHFTMAYMSGYVDINGQLLMGAGKGTHQHFYHVSQPQRQREPDLEMEMQNSALHRKNFFNLPYTVGGLV